MARAEGSVYVAEEGALFTGVGKRANTIIFEGEAARAFKPHPVEGWYSPLKRAGGQYKAGFGDLELVDSEIVGNQLIVRKVKLVEGLQTPLAGQSRLWGRRLLIEAGVPASYFLLKKGALSLLAPSPWQLKQEPEDACSP